MCQVQDGLKPIFNEDIVFYGKMHRNLRLQGKELETWPLLFKGCVALFT